MYALARVLGLVLGSVLQEVFFPRELLNTNFLYFNNNKVDELFFMF